jgi:hypothetical protein
MRGLYLLSDPLVRLLRALPDRHAVLGEPVPPDATAFVDRHRYALAGPAPSLLMIWLIRSPVAVRNPGGPARNSRRMTLVACSWWQSQGRIGCHARMRIGARRRWSACSPIGVEY